MCDSLPAAAAIRVSGTTVPNNLQTMCDRLRNLVSLVSIKVCFESDNYGLTLVVNDAAFFIFMS